jgi:hypothetical protein
MHRRTLLLALGGLVPASMANAQQLGDILKSVAASQISGTASGLPTGVSSAEADGGLRQALTNSAINAVLKVGKLDGFWQDSAIRIPLPGQLAKIQGSLKSVGMSKPLDDLQLKINRGAETAAPKAKDIFVGAIKAMTIEDVAGVLRGGNTSATDFLRRSTGSKLTTLFTPPIDTAMASSGAVKSLDQVVAKYGAQSLLNGKSARQTLTDFAVGKALDGVFHYVATEETAIRTNPGSRTTDLLKKVFGSL